MVGGGGFVMSEDSVACVCGNGNDFAAVMGVRSENVRERVVRVRRWRRCEFQCHEGARWVGAVV